MIRIKINNPRSFRPSYLKEANESLTKVDPSVSLMRHDRSYFESLIPIQITLKERILETTNLYDIEKNDSLTKLYIGILVLTKSKNVADQFGIKSVEYKCTLSE